MNFSRTLAALGLALILPAAAGSAQVLTTPHYVITITSQCEEGNVGCGDVSYAGKNRKTGKSIRLKGRDLMHYCPGDQGDGPGKTPCRHLGYQFRNGATVYEVSDEGQLTVWSETGRRGRDGTRARKLLLDETGKWDWQR